MNEPRMTMTINEVCEQLGFSRAIVDRFIHRADNPIPTIRTGRGYRVSRAALERWIEEEGQRNAAATSRKR